MRDLLVVPLALGALVALVFGTVWLWQWGERQRKAREAAEEKTRADGEAKRKRDNKTRVDEGTHVDSGELRCIVLKGTPNHCPHPAKVGRITFGPPPAPKGFMVAKSASEQIVATPIGEAKHCTAHGAMYQQLADQDVASYDHEVERLRGIEQAKLTHAEVKGLDERVAALSLAQATPERRRSRSIPPKLESVPRRGVA